MSATKQAVRLANVLARAAAEKLGADIIAMDVSEPLAITDVFVLVTASNERQVGAIVDMIDDVAARVGQRVVRREGEGESRWVLLDLLDVIVHIMQPDDRQLYSLERIWRDAPRLDLDLDAPLPPALRQVGVL
ncbi:MAG: ribosome silencing factor [Propionibacteriaceae bacterium]|nr:ribosome silencing factor [Propionibacteriaceae bacterium]